MEPCTTISRFCDLPRPSKRRWKKNLVYICPDCHKLFYIVKVLHYAFGDVHVSYNWKEVISNELNIK